MKKDPKNVKRTRAETPDHWLSPNVISGPSIFLIKDPCYRGYACDIIIIPGSCAKWPVCGKQLLSGYFYYLISKNWLLSDYLCITIAMIKVTLPLTLPLDLPLDLPFTLSRRIPCIGHMHIRHFVLLPGLTWLAKMDKTKESSKWINFNTQLSHALNTL